MTLNIVPPAPPSPTPEFYDPKAGDVFVHHHLLNKQDPFAPTAYLIVTMKDGQLGWVNLSTEGFTPSVISLMGPEDFPTSIYQRFTIANIDLQEAL